VTRFLLDTMVVSESIKVRPDPAAAAWLQSHSIDACYLSVLTLGELQFGIARLPVASARRAELARWLEDTLLPTFRDRILPFDRDAALEWGVSAALAAARGKTLQTADAQIAATAKTRDLTLVTRNVRDFDGIDIEMINPWG
jgi:toxin FitB